MVGPPSPLSGETMAGLTASLRFICGQPAKCWANPVAKKEGKRRSVAQQMGEILRQWQEALDSADPQRAIEELITEYEATRPGAVNAPLAREASRERLSAMRLTGSGKEPSGRRESEPRAPRK